MSKRSYLPALLCLTLVAGCDGCRREPPENAEESEQPQRPLAEFEASLPVTFPADRNTVGGGVKPGHWLTGSRALKSNQADARGELQSAVLIPPPSPAGTPPVGSPPSGPPSTGEPRAGLPSVRPVVLPKGQSRRFDFRLFPPLPESAKTRQVLLRNRFVAAQRSAYYEPGQQPVSLLSSQEYFFVILTSRAERFAAYQVANWVRPYQNEFDFEPPPPNYRVVIPPADDGLLPLSETMLAWTSTAAVLWDDVPAQSLTPAQQQALRDWVWFGGTLIVNGSEAADALDNTVLGDLLAVRPTGNVELDADAAATLLTEWSVPTDRSTEQQVSLIRDRTARIAVEGTAVAGAEAVPDSGGLVVSRRLGRGRVVQTRFDLTAKWLTGWESYDSFVNAAVLGRPPRRFVSVDDGPNSGIRQRYPGSDLTVATAAMNTRLRLAARDSRLGTLGFSADASRPGNALRGRERDGADARPDEASDEAAEPSSPADGFSAVEAPSIRPDPIAGLGSWSDDSDAIAVARTILRDESGIEIPGSELVVRSVGIYLLILVPLNYLFFRLIGRLEYAWLAVPLIAAVGAVWVARAARLDIGFARSQTEFALLELQPGYARAHLSRLVAIYNSLSSRYNIAFVDHDSLAAPLGLARGETDGAVLRTGFAKGPELSGVAVGSNQVRMVHGEQLLDVGGPIRIIGGRVVNDSEYELLDALVIRRDGTEDVRVAAMGLVSPGTETPIRYQDSSGIRIAEDLPMQAARLIRGLVSPPAVPPDSMRLVARIDAAMPGMTITPEATQRKSQTVVLAHLRHPDDPPARPDVNLLSDVVAEPERDEAAGSQEKETGPVR